MQVEIKRYSGPNEDFEQLVAALDAYLTVTDGDEHAFYDQFNATTHLKHIVLAYKNGAAIGCGAFNPYSNDTTEIKRMYVAPDHRGTGVAGLLLGELEDWSAASGFRFCILETGKRQVEAVAFYKKMGYQQIPNYDQYAQMQNSICFRKTVAPLS